MHANMGYRNSFTLWYPLQYQLQKWQIGQPVELPASVANISAVCVSQLWKPKGCLQSSPFWWRWALGLCVWCLPSAGHLRQCAPTPTPEPSSWWGRRFTRPPCCCWPCCAQVTSPEPRALCICVLIYSYLTWLFSQCSSNTLIACSQVERRQHF